MSVSDRIPTPWTYKWQRFRYGALPVLSFAVSVMLSLSLWDLQARRSNVVGEVAAVRIAVAAGTDGVLLPLSQRQWTLFDTVQANQTIARLDDRPAQAALETFRKELTRLRSEVDAAAARIELERSNLDRDHRREAVRLAWQIERQRLQVLDRRAVIETDRVELQREITLLASQESLLERNAFARSEVVQSRFRRDEVAKRIEQNTAALVEAEQQRKSAMERLKNFPELVPSAVARLLAAVQARTAVQECRIRELQLQIASLEVRAPISGTISAIHLWPGQAIRAGDPIVTIAADHSRYIVSYVRQEQRFRPTTGTLVAVRLRDPGSRATQATVERVGPQVEPVPIHQLRDPKVPEWGLPVRITLPPALNVRPGELMDITFKSKPKDG